MSGSTEDKDRQPETEDDANAQRAERRRGTSPVLSPNIRRKLILFSTCLLIFVIALSPPLWRWYRAGENRAVSLSNLHRLASAALLYGQDWDECLPRPTEHMQDGSWHTWVDPLKPYGVARERLSNPANPVPGHGSILYHPTDGYAVPTSYALNRRYWGTFAAGPFPMDNLELQAQTVLFVEAGPLSTQTRGALQPTNGAAIALLEYGDTLDRVNSLIPYPSTHDGSMAVVAADGHTVVLRVEHYTSADGVHDPLYGRIGADIYNWNGGRPNGEVDRPPRE